MDLDDDLKYWQLQSKSEIIRYENYKIRTITGQEWQQKRQSRLSVIRKDRDKKSVIHLHSCFLSCK